MSKCLYFFHVGVVLQSKYYVVVGIEQMPQKVRFELFANWSVQSNIHWSVLMC